MIPIKVLTIFGTRPEATKMCPLVNEIKLRNNLKQIVCVTAQHREMLDQVLTDFDIVPDYDLNLMQHGQTLSQITSRALCGLEEIMLAEKPDLVLVHGDTATTFAASLAAFYCKTKIGHVEAGLRTYDKYQPYPEEINRKLTTALADLNFAPTRLSKENLLKENVSADSIYITGNTAIDCLKNSLRDNYVFENEALNTIDYEHKKVITMTSHRNENGGEPMERICRAALQIVNGDDDVFLVWPVHANPLIKQMANKYLFGHERILLTPALDMVEMHNLMSKSYLILTDSGGLQEEAPAMHKPVVVMRNVTERPEGVEAGTLVMAGSEDETVIYETVMRLLRDPVEYNKMASSKNPYGDGNASLRIADAIEYHFGFTSVRPTDYIS